VSQAILKLFKHMPHSCTNFRAFITFFLPVFNSRENDILGYMSESFGGEKSKEQQLKENVIGSNEKFLSELEGATSVEELIEMVQDYSNVEDGEHVLFEVGVDGEGNPDLTKAFNTDEMVAALSGLRETPLVDAKNADEWFEHKDVAAALKRIYNLE
ncbi:MAG: hypothetical protein RLZZ480_599, partial [Candidatus Parcubacteria bacterium]